MYEIRAIFLLGNDRQNGSDHFIPEKNCSDNRVHGIQIDLLGLMVSTQKSILKNTHWVRTQLPKQCQKLAFQTKPAKFDTFWLGMSNSKNIFKNIHLAEILRKLRNKTLLGLIDPFTETTSLSHCKMFLYKRYCKADYVQRHVCFVIVHVKLCTSRLCMKMLWCGCQGERSKEK